MRKTRKLRLLKLFREQERPLGVTPIRWCRLAWVKRVAYAKKILVETDESVEAIGAQIGYADRKQFYKEFKEKVGCTPKQYRENYRRQ